MVIVTGGAGFIGSNIVRGLNAQGITDIIVVDDLTDGTKFTNIAALEIADYLDKDDFLAKIKQNHNFGDVQTIFHQGACSATTEWNGQYMMENNYEYSKHLLHYCLKRNIHLLYASSAAVYGAGRIFSEVRANEAPLNVYGYSKQLFDQYVRRYAKDATSQVVGMRYFNVYGPHEQHKGSMSSVAYHLNQQLLESGVIKLFEGCDGYAHGEQQRDFIYIDDVVNINLWFMANPQQSGIFNVGTGAAEPFNAIAEAVLAWHKRGELTYIPFPDHLKGCYQSFTQANIERLRQAGYTDKFHTVAEGVKKYLDDMHSEN